MVASGRCVLICSQRSPNALGAARDGLISSPGRLLSCPGAEPNLTPWQARVFTGGMEITQVHSPEPTIESHPFRVGRMVYPTATEAFAAIDRALEVYPTADLVVIDRRIEGVLACELCDEMASGTCGADPELIVCADCYRDQADQADPDRD